jgi:hypothetical protein
MAVSVYTQWPTLSEILSLALLVQSPMSHMAVLLFSTAALPSGLVRRSHWAQTGLIALVASTPHCVMSCSACLLLSALPSRFLAPCAFASLASAAGLLSCVSLVLVSDRRSAVLSAAAFSRWLALSYSASARVLYACLGAAALPHSVDAASVSSRRA